MDTETSDQTKIGDVSIKVEAKCSLIPTLTDVKTYALSIVTDCDVTSMDEIGSQQYMVGDGV